MINSDSNHLSTVPRKFFLGRVRVKRKNIQARYRKNSESSSRFVLSEFVLTEKNPIRAQQSWQIPRLSSWYDEIPVIRVRVNEGLLYSRRRHHIPGSCAPGTSWTFLNLNFMISEVKNPCVTVFTSFWPFLAKILVHDVMTQARYTSYILNVFQTVFLISDMKNP